MPRISLRQTAAMSRPTANRTENLLSTSRHATTNSKSIIRSARLTATSNTGCSTRAIASSQAKSISYATSQLEDPTPVTSKRKREVLADVTDNNCIMAWTAKTVKSHRPHQFSQPTTTARIDVPPCPKYNNVSVISRCQPVYSHPRSTETTQGHAALPVIDEDEEEDIILYERRRIAEVVEAVPISEDACIDEERIAHQLFHSEDEDDDMTGLWDDIDAEDMDDPLMVAEYAVDICKHWKDTETKYLPDAHYMENQQYLTWGYRGMLLDWLAQVHTICPFTIESFFICVNILDRFCSVYHNIPLKRYQLAGIASVLIASKFEEVVSISASRLVEWTNHAYSLEQLLQAECYILDTIGWDLSYPGPMGWLRRASRADGLEIRSRTIAKYLLEVGIFEPRLISVPPSLMAAAAIYLARLAMDREDWTYNLIHYSTYQEWELIPVASVMLTYIASVQPPHLNLYNKYASRLYLKASIWMREWTVSRWMAGSEIDLADKLTAIKADICDARIAG